MPLSGRPWNVNAQASKFRTDLFGEHLGSHYDEALVAASHPTSIAHIQHAAQQHWLAFEGLYHLEMQYLDHEERARGITDSEQVQDIHKTTRK